MEGYVSLAEYVKLIESDEANFIVDNRDGREFQVNEEQYELLSQLDGKRRFDEVLSVYAEGDRRIVRDYIQNLSNEGLVKFYPSEKVGVSRKNSEKIHPYLSGVLFDVTSLCNLHCGHCYVGNYYQERKGNDLEFHEIEAVLDELQAMNIRDITITGGEALLRSDIHDIISGIMRRNIRLASFFTNGIALTSSFADFLAELPQRVRVYVSLDGATSHSHELIRGRDSAGQETFQSVLRAINLLVERNIVVTVNTCLHEGNYSELSDMYAMLKTLGVKHWRMAVPKPIGRHQDGWKTTYPNWKNILDAYSTVLDKHLQDVLISDEIYFSPIELEIELLFRTEMVSKVVKLYQSGDTACAYHSDRCAIKANGDVITCGYFDYLVAGNVRKQSFRDIWQSREMQDVKTMKVADVSDCVGCEYLEQCGTGCRAIAHRTENAISAKDPYACALVIPFHREIFPRLMEKYKLSINTTRENFQHYIIDKNRESD